MTVALMYHALYRDDDHSSIDAEDLPYAVSEANFKAQLDVLSDKRVGILDASTQSVPDVVITFDDGHASNHDIALPLLAERQMTACFFVTSGYIGHRRGFCVPSQLAELVESGMVVGAHGVTHAFFDDLSIAAAEEELRTSRDVLADYTGSEIDSMSFPGGRFNRHVLANAYSLGYARLFGSGFGTIETQNLTHRGVLDRVPVRRGTTLTEFSRVVDADSTYFAVQRSKQQLKGLARKALGNRIYHGLYKSVASR